MLVIIANSFLESSQRIERFLFPVPNPDDIQIVLSQANRMLNEKGWTVLYRTFHFVNCGYDVDETGRLKPLETT